MVEGSGGVKTLDKLLAKYCRYDMIEHYLQKDGRGSFVSLMLGGNIPGEIFLGLSHKGNNAVNDMSDGVTPLKTLHMPPRVGTPS